MNALTLRRFVTIVAFVLTFPLTAQSQGSPQGGSFDSKPFALLAEAMQGPFRIEELDELQGAMKRVVDWVGQHPQDWLDRSKANRDRLTVISELPAWKSRAEGERFLFLMLRLQVAAGMGSLDDGTGQSLRRTADTLREALKAVDNALSAVTMFEGANKQVLLSRKGEIDAALQVYSATVDGLPGSQ